MMHTTHLFYSLLVVLVASAQKSLLINEGMGSEMEPEAVVDSLISHRHGFRMLDTSGKQMLEAVEQKPGIVVPIIASKLHSIRNFTDLDRVGAKRCGALFGLLARIASEEARAVLHEYLDRFNRKIHSLTRGQYIVDGKGDLDDDALRAYRQIALLRNGIIEILEEVRDPYAIDVCIQALRPPLGAPAQDGSRFVMMRYLASVAPLRPDVKPGIQRLFDDPKSGAFRRPMLARALEAIERAKQEGDAGGNDPDRADKPEARE